jgi:hypothetical protein
VAAHPYRPSLHIIGDYDEIERRYNNGMPPGKKRILIILLVMAAAAFALLALPNAAASQNMSMVQMFEPDEAAPLPSVLHMIAPAASPEQALRSFVFYEYYYYGFPYFALSALLVLPLQLLGRVGDLPLVMLVLRQLVSVLPMLAGLLILVYLQDGFRTYRSPVLFGFLLIVPAVLSNNFWWHPDGITFLFVMLTLFFLVRDNLRFGWNFLLAAVMSGVAAATKLIGLDFFLAVGLTLVLGLLLRKATWKRIAGMAAAYLLVMGLAFVAANPFLLSHWARTAYTQIVTKQSALLSQGYGIIYEKGLAASWPVMHPFYGEALFLLVTVGCLLWGVWRSQRRLLYALILAWVVPVSVTVFWFSNFKYQYWLPAALPLFSCLILLLPTKGGAIRIPKLSQILQAAALLVVVAQAGLFARAAVINYNNRLHRADNNPRIQFYDQVVKALNPLSGQPVHLYFDYRMYLPDTPGWTAETNYDLLEYGYIQQGHFDVLLLLEQRIRDYLHPDAKGIDPELFARNQQFYRDADQGTIQGYHLMYRDAVGLVYVRDGL